MAKKHTCATKGHNSIKGKRNFCVYTVYDKKTALPVIVDGDAAACARVMGIKRDSFYRVLCRFRNGTLRDWEIYPRYVDGREDFREGEGDNG